MAMEFETKGKQKVDVHYVDAPIACVVEESFGGYFLDHDDLTMAEELQNQECVYQSFQRNSQNGMNRASSSAGSRSESVHAKSIGEMSSSKNARLDTQLAIDEALARELQELELDDSSIAEVARAESNTTPNQAASASSERNSARTSSQVAWEGDIDPANMSYEELQHLGEAIGTQSRGLPDELISLLPEWTYKTGLFSKKDKFEECVICYMAYKNRDKLMRLPCQHHYHKVCITKWLKLKKTCPVCNKEVFGS